MCNRVRVRCLCRVVGRDSGQESDEIPLNMWPAAACSDPAARTGAQLTGELVVPANVWMNGAIEMTYTSEKPLPGDKEPRVSLPDTRRTWFGLAALIPD